MKPTLQSIEENVLICNIGSEVEPKMIKISKTVPKKERNRYIKMLKKFVEIFSCSYKYLKTYNTNIIQNKIPLNPNTNPFK